MAGSSSIEWTEATWNPLGGCAMVSPGCTNCYAMRLAGRLAAMGNPMYQDLTRKSGGRFVWTGRVRLNENALEAPLSWRKPSRIFVNSMSDLFQEEVPDQFVERVWQVMREASWHTFQILTKRPHRMRALVTALQAKPLPNVWLGTSVESSEYLHRLVQLRATPARVRFVSFEPLLGPIERPDLRKIDWVIVGGESGPGARPMRPEWVEHLRVKCEQTETAFFFKQWGGTNKKRSGRVLDGRTWDDMPAPHSP
jgi:protein gp37